MDHTLGTAGGVCDIGDNTGPRTGSCGAVSVFAKNGPPDPEARPKVMGGNSGL